MDINTFKLSNLTLEDDSSSLNQQADDKGTAREALNGASSITAEKPVASGDLGRQVIYLNQRIDYLSKKLAALTTGDLADNYQTSDGGDGGDGGEPSKNRSSVVLEIGALQVTEAAQTNKKRVAIVDSLFQLPLSQESWPWSS